MSSKIIYICPECRCVVQTESILTELHGDIIIIENNPIEDYLGVCYHLNKSQSERCPGVGLSPIPIEIC